MSNGLGDIVPEDFPRATYNKVAHFAHEKIRPSPILEHFHDSWLAGGYRYCTCAEHDAAFRASIERAGNSPPQSEHYVQERELFGFFVSGLTTIECFAYSCYALGAVLDVASFPIENLRALTVKTTSNRFAQCFPNDPISQTLVKLIKDKEYKDWVDARNILAHRSLPKRKVTVQLWPPQPESSKTVTWLDDTIEVNSTTTTARRVWLSLIVRELIIGVDEFNLSHFK
jgi:hypothetical protein